MHSPPSVHGCSQSVDAIDYPALVKDKDGEDGFGDCEMELLKMPAETWPYDKYGNEMPFKDPYTFQKQIAIKLLNLDSKIPDVAIVGISTETRGIGKSKIMERLTKVFQGYALTLNPKTDFDEIANRRLDPEKYDKFVQRPLLFFDLKKEDEDGKKIVENPFDAKELNKFGFHQYLEYLSDGDWAYGKGSGHKMDKWDGAKPLIIFIGNDALPIEKLGSFSAHRVHYYTIRGIGEENHMNLAEDYKLVVDEKLMGMLQLKGKEQSRKGNFVAHAQDAGVDADVFIFLTFFNIHPVKIGQEQSSKERMMAKQVCAKLLKESKEHFGNLGFFAGQHFKVSGWDDWYKAKQEAGKLGGIKKFDYARTPHLNVSLKKDAKYAPFVSE